MLLLTFATEVREAKRLPSKSKFCGHAGMSGSESDVLTLTREESVAWITLNRPQSINAINEDIRTGLPRLLKELDEDASVRVIVIRGSGERGFCAGADLKAERQNTAPQISWIESIAEVRKPTIAGIHGYCLGGGLEIALACDVRIAAENAQFGLPETGLGLIPGGGGTQRLPRIIGLGRALDLLLSAERINAAEAYRIGLITRLVPRPDDLKDALAQLSARIARLPPLAVRSVKQASHAAPDMALRAGLGLESQLFANLLATEDRTEAARAFKEKRAPVFTGS
jgi:enoyl-CoA hydratase/carnithine racemase